MTISLVYLWILRIIAFLLWCRAIYIHMMPEKERNEYFIKKYLKKTKESP